MRSWLALLFCMSWIAFAAEEKPATANPQTNAPAKEKDVPLPSARAVIDRYIEVAGGKDAFLRHTSVLIKGKTEVTGKDLGGGMTLATAKPNKMLLVVDLAGIAIRTGFDGKVGWQVNPLTGPSIMEDGELRDMERQADFFSILHDDKGFKSMQNVGKVDFEGESCYKIKLVYADGGDITEYYSVKTGLQKGFTGTQESSLGTITATSVNEEHKKYGDLLLPSRVTQKMASAGLSQTMVIDSVEYDHVPDSLFEPPAEIRALLRGLEDDKKAANEQKPANGKPLENSKQPQKVDPTEKRSPTPTKKEVI